MSATIRDVARALGLHMSTVSRTFSAPHLVNSDTRRRVLAMAEQLGYRPNRAARALVTGRTHNLGLIVADIANPFFPPLVKAAEQQARARDHHLFVADTDEDPLVEAELVQALAKQVDGILLCSPRMSNARIDQLREDVPLVTINRRVPGLRAVVMDEAAGATAAVEHLVGLGHRRIALLTGPRGSWSSGQIRRAAAATAERNGARLVVFGPNAPITDSGAIRARQVCEDGASAVVAYNDVMAIGLIEGLDQLGLRVPADVSVIGFDDIPASRLVRPKLTTIANPTAAAGRAAVDLLLQEANGSLGAAELTLPTTLMIRDSTGRAAPPRVTRPTRIPRTLTSAEPKE